jgi:hypothetical protein
VTDPERDHLLGRIADLERRLRRWRLACLALLVLLLLPVVLGGLLGVWWVPRLEHEKAARLQREQAERDTYERLVQFEQEARHEAERQRAVSEEEVRRLREQQVLEMGKD